MRAPMLTKLILSIVAVVAVAVAAVAVVASGLNRRVSIVASPSSFFLAKIKIQILAGDTAKFRTLIFAASGLNRCRRRVASRRVVSKSVSTCSYFGFDICNPKLFTLKNRSSTIPSLQNIKNIYF